MKIAAYNVENLFDRARAFSEPTAEAQRVVKEEREIHVASDNHVVWCEIE